MPIYASRRRPQTAQTLYLTEKSVLWYAVLSLLASLSLYVVCKQTKILSKLCIGLSPLAARAGASFAQDCRSDIQSLAPLHGLPPQYLGPLGGVADLPGRRAFRSSGTSHLIVSPVRLSTSTVANRTFRIVGPRIWNDLPADVTSAESLSTFCQRLKTSAAKVLR